MEKVGPTVVPEEGITPIKVPSGCHGEGNHFDKDAALIPHSVEMQ